MMVFIKLKEVSWTSYHIRFSSKKQKKSFSNKFWESFILIPLLEDQKHIFLIETSSKKKKKAVNIISGTISHLAMEDIFL